jgi:photosystem II stability/assembly factor-like uncharacterized protein
MRTLCTVLFICLITIFLAGTTQAQWVQANGPYGGTVNCFAVDGIDLFAGTDDGGVFRSTDNGTHWTAVNDGLTNLDVHALTASGTNLFAGTRLGGIFRSTDHGTHWTAVNDGLPSTYVGSLVVSGTNLFAGTHGGGVFSSTNNGTHWTAVNDGLPWAYVNALAVSESYIFAGSIFGSAGVFLSSNQGTSWTAVNEGLTYKAVLALAVSGSNLFAGTKGGGVFRSTDNGTQWMAANDGLKAEVWALAVSGPYLFAGTPGGIFRSSNDGTTWTAVNAGLRSGYVSSFAVNGVDVYAGIGREGVYRSTDDGASWTASNEGLTNTRVGEFAESGSYIFTLTTLGVFRSADTGSNWTAANQGLPDNGPNHLVSNGLYLYTASNPGGVYRSGDNGTSWTSIGLTNIAVNAIATSGTNVIVATNPGDVFRSTDNGTNWTNTGLMNTQIAAFATNGMNVFAARNNPEGVIRSTDNGANWTNTGLINTSAYPLAASGTNVFAATYPPDILLSVDNGESWTSTGLVNTVVRALATSGTNLFAVTDSGCFLSVDNGASRNLISAGLPISGANTVSAIGQNLFVGFSGSGIWKRPLSEVILAKVSHSVIDFGSIFVGSIHSDSFKIYNVSSESLVLDSVYTNFPGIEIDKPHSPLMPGDSCTIQIRYSPTSCGKLHHTVVCEFNGGRFRAGAHIFADVSTPWRISPEIVNFGDITSCFQYEQTVTLYNVGNESIKLDSLIPPDQSIHLSGICHSINPGDSCEVTIRFVPTTDGQSDYSIPIIHDVKCSSAINISANVRSPIRYSRTSIDFGNIVGLGVPNQDSVILHNDGIGNLLLDTMYSETDEIAMEVAKKLILPGDSCVIRLIYTPRIYGDMSCRVRFSFNGLCVLGEILISSIVTSGGAPTWIHTALDSVDVTSFAVSPNVAGGKNLFTGTGKGIFLSTNSGTSWTEANEGLTSTSVSTLAVSGDYLFAGTRGGGIYLSTNIGTSWTPVTSGLPYIDALVVHGTKIFASSSIWYPRGKFGGEGHWEYLGIHLSTDNGTSWTAIDSGLTDWLVRTLAVSGTNVFAGTSSGIFISTNDGTNWTAINGGLTNTDVRTLSVTSHNTGIVRLFAGTHGGGAFVTTDNGLNWQPVNVGLRDSIVVGFATIDTTIFAITGTMVFYSNNNGMSWIADDTRFTNPHIAALIAVGSDLYAGTSGSGVWKRPLSEMIIDNVEPLLKELPTQYVLNQNYPNPFNPTTTISYQLPTQSHVTLKVFDMLGRDVATLVNSVEQPGFKSVNFNANNLVSGVYFYRLQAGNYMQTKKLLLLR